MEAQESGVRGRRGGRRREDQFSDVQDLRGPMTLHLEYIEVPSWGWLYLLWSMSWRVAEMVEREAEGTRAGGIGEWESADMRLEMEKSLQKRSSKIILYSKTWLEFMEVEVINPKAGGWRERVEGEPREPLGSQMKEVMEMLVVVRG